MADTNDDPKPKQPDPKKPLEDQLRPSVPEGDKTKAEDSAAPSSNASA